MGYAGAHLVYHNGEKIAFFSILIRCFSLFAVNVNKTTLKNDNSITATKIE
uniref:Uncharacterized protein n=1 Tax=Ascaris lumbricoides TaxID=6252 RepID=A0A0M3IDW4_ASCLU